MNHLLSIPSSAASATKTNRQDKRLTNKERFFRVLLMTSLFFKFKGCPDPDENTLVDFNKKYGLVTRIDSLWIPSVLSKWLWRKLDVVELERQVLSAEITIAQANARIASVIPKKGHYKGMMSDIERLLADNIKVR